MTVCEVVTPWAYPEREFTSRATVSVVIPTLNEAANIAHVLPKLPAGVDQVVLVDGGSTDGTVEVARRLRPDMTIIQQTRRGKGNALACGFAAATGDIIVMMDADGSTHPAEISRFVEELVKSGADFAKGSRFVPGGGSSDITSLRRAGNSVLSTLVNTLCRTHYTDLCYGFNAFWRRCLPALDLEHASSGIMPESGGSDREPMQWGDGFEIETLITIRVARGSLRARRGSELRARPPPRPEQPQRLLRRSAGSADDPRRGAASLVEERRAGDRDGGDPGTARSASRSRGPAPVRTRLRLWRSSGTGYLT